MAKTGVQANPRHAKRNAIKATPIIHRKGGARTVGKLIVVLTTKVLPVLVVITEVVIAINKAKSTNAEAA
jgi:hypothetical protein